jgi:hypothetical protein
VALLLGPYATKKISGKVKNADFRNKKEAEKRRAKQVLNILEGEELTPTDPRFLQAIREVKRRKTAELEHLIEELQLRYSLCWKGATQRTANHVPAAKKAKSCKE